MKPTSTQTGVAARSAWPIGLDPEPLERQHGEPGAGRGADADRHPPRHARCGAPAAGPVVRLQGGKALRPGAGTGLRARDPHPPRRAGQAALWSRERDRALVDLGDLGGHARPREALGTLARGHGHPLAASRVGCQGAQRLAELDRVARRHQQAVHAVPDHVAVSRDVGGHDRGARGERLGQHHAEALAAERGRAEQVHGAEQAPLLLLGHPPDHVHALRVEQERLDLLGGDARDREPRAHAGAAQRLEGPQQDRQALAPLGATDEEDLQVVPGRRPGPGGGQVHAVRDDAVAAAVEAACGPRRGLGHGHPGAQLVVEATRADDVRGHVVRHAGRGVGVEGAHHGNRAPLDGEPADRRDVRLVHVHHVVAAGAQLVADHAHRARRERQVRHRAVHGQPHGASQRDPVVGQRPTLRRNAAMHDTSQAIVGVEGGQQPDLVVLPHELLEPEPPHDARPRPDTCTSRAKPARRAPHHRSGRRRRPNALHQRLRGKLRRPPQLRRWRSSAITSSTPS